MPWFILLILMLNIFSINVLSYRFICNGILANGDERLDECGICDDEHAARWPSSTIEVVIDNSVLPKHLSLSQWHNVVEQSFRSWESVSGSDLHFISKNESSLRQFGANDNIHEIFWITDKKEWRKLVGAGEFGTLGATLPRYICDASRQHRTIFDADLVLNGMPHINWQVDCHHDNCISPLTTLTHELGHFIGLDHPCLTCSSSIMSARAGFDLKAPVFDDMQGLRVLYPDSSHGGYGFPCDHHQDCQADLSCIYDGHHQYCSYSCEQNECDMVSICQNTSLGKFCMFVDDEAAGGKNQGNSCIKKPCSEPLVCAGSHDDNFFCYMPCHSNMDCALNQSCVPIEQDLSLCVVIKKLNESCNYVDLCDDGLYCVFENINSGFCRKPCSLTKTCYGSDTCQRIIDGVDVCLPYSYKLDDSFDGFDAAEKPLLGTKKNPISSCQDMRFNEKNDILWLVIILLWLVKIWYSPFYLLRIGTQYHSKRRALNK